METLEHGDYKKQYPEVLEELKPKFGNLEGVKVTVEEDYHNEVVELSIGNNDLVLTIEQARNLAKHIRMAANRLEKHTRINRNIK